MVYELKIKAINIHIQPSQRQAINWTIVGILLIGPLGTNFSEILIQILTFSFKKMHLLYVKWWPFYPGLNVLKSAMTSSIFVTRWPQRIG